MPLTFSARRITLLRDVCRRGSELLRFDPSRLRFSLGTSLGDVRIPVQVAPDAGAIVRSAATELALLLASRHRKLVPADDLDRVFLADGFANLPDPAPTLGASGGGADLRAAAEQGVAAHPALLGGVVCAWMGPGGRGRSLTGLVIQALQQALAEADRTHREDDTPLVVAAALFAELAASEERLRPVLPSPPLDRHLRAATLTGLWVAAQTGLSRVWRTSGRPADDPLLTRTEAFFSPVALIGPGGRSGSTLHGYDLDVPLSLDDAAARLSAGDDPEAVAADLARALAADEELSRRAELAVAVGRIRETLRAGVAALERARRAGLAAELSDIHAAPGALAAALVEDRARSALLERLDQASVGAEVVPQLGQAARALRAWRRPEPASCIGMSRGAARAEYARAAAAMACDGALELLMARARRAVLARTGAEVEGGLETEWREGRLYRITAHPGPILDAVVQQPLGHLFADVKDFTRRTGLLGPAAMAELLRTEFYMPLLAAAKSFVLGMPHLADRGGVSVNNLLGDAISFSGDIEALVALAREVHRVFAAYEARLAQEISSDAVARQLAAIEARFDAELARLDRTLAQAAPTTPAGHVQHMKERRARLRDDRARAIRRARGEGIEAGVFISFGPPPVTVLIDDEVFGRNRVAVAEKINESARGTARAGTARARADAALAAEQAAQGRPDLRHAWRVFVEPPLSIAVPAAVERSALAAARGGDMTTALRALGGPVREALERAAGASGEEPGDIYNGGAALSEEALAQFLHVVKDARELRRVELAPDQIPLELRARWFYGTGPLELVAAFRRDGRPAELFRRVGVAAFKGLGEVTVWELAAERGGPAELLSRFGKGWLAGQR